MEGVSQPSSRPSLRPYANLLWFSFFNATTWMVALGTPLVLLAGQLGASSFEVGLAYSFVFLLLPVQVLATATLPRFGYKRQVIFGWSSRGVFLLIPLWLAWLAPATPARWMVCALVASAFFFSFFRTLGACGVMPLIYGVLPEPIRGRYFNVDQAVTAVSGIFTLLLSALLFRVLPLYDAFFWQYLYAIAGMFLTVYFLTRVEDPPKPRATSLKAIVAETPVLCLRPSPFRQYLLFMLVSSLAGPAFVPLVAYYLKVEAGLAPHWILVYTAVQYLGVIIGTLLMRDRADRIGVKPLFRLSLLLGAAISLYWYLLVTGHAALRHGLGAAYFVFGFAASQWVTAHLKYLPRVCAEDRQALHVSVHSAVVGMLGGVAPIVWGWLVKTPGALPGVRPDRFALFFLVLLGAQLLLFLYVPRLTSEHRERPALQPGPLVLRPFRYFGNLINVLPPDADRDTRHGHGTPSGGRR